MDNECVTGRRLPTRNHVSPFGLRYSSRRSGIRRSHACAWHSIVWVTCDVASRSLKSQEVVWDAILSAPFGRLGPRAPTAPRTPAFYFVLAPCYLHRSAIQNPETQHMNDLFGAASPRRGKPAPINGKSGARNGTPDETNYTAASIEVLEGLEPVRRRPACMWAARMRTRCIISSLR